MRSVVRTHARTYVHTDTKGIVEKEKALFHIPTSKANTKSINGETDDISGVC